MNKAILIIFLILISSVANADADADFKEAVGYFTSSLSSSYDYKKAFDIGEKLNQQDDCRGGYILGSIYANGFGVNKDINKAKDLFFKSANAACAVSMSYIGWAYVLGPSLLGFPIDNKNAVNWLSKSYVVSINNNKNAMACNDARKIAEIYYDEKNYSDALSWYQKVRTSGGKTFCTDDKTLTRVSELENSLQMQAEQMREDPPVVGVTLSLGGESKATKKPKKKNN